MRRRGVIAALAVGVAALGVATYALAGGSGAGFNHLTATMSGYQEVPAVSSVASATFTADVSPLIPATAAARTQGIDTGEYQELVRAIDAGKTYANIHSTKWPGGEIRAQLNEGDPHN